MKTCFNQATTMKHSTLKKDLLYCEKYGYDYIEIRLDKLKEYLKDNTLEDLKVFFENNNIKPYAYNGLEEINYRNDKDFSIIMEDLDLACRASDIVGGKFLTMDSNFNVGHQTITQIRNETVKVISKIIDKAEKYSMKLAFEFIGHPACCVNTFNQAYDIIQTVNRSDVGLILDFFHFHAMGSRLEDIKASDIDSIFIVHINDTEDLPIGALTDSDRLWPGDGAVDTHGLMTTLVEMGYDGVFSLELFRPEYWDMPIEDCIKKGKEKTDFILSQYR